MEFSIADLVCFAGRARESAERFRRLLEKYPENVRAYEICRPHRHPAPAERRLRDDPVVGAGECPEEVE
jgi:hypothetical protein